MYVTKTRIFWFIFICLIFGLWIYHKNNVVKLKQTSSPSTPVINPFIPYDNNLSTPDMKTKYVKFYSELFKTPHVFAEDLWVCRDNVSGEMGYYQPNLNCCMTRSGRKTDYGIMDTNYQFTWKTNEPTFPLYNVCGLTIIQLKPIEDITDDNWTYNPLDNTIILSRFGKQTLSLVTDSTEKVNVFLVELSKVEELGVDDKWIYDSVTQKIELKSLSNRSTTRKFLTVEYFYDQEGVDLSKIYLNPQSQDTWSINTNTKKIIWNNFNARTNKQNVTLGLTPLRIIGNWSKSGNQYTCQVNSEIMKINSLTSNFFFLNREFTNSLTNEAVINNPQLNQSAIDCQISWNTDICSNPCSSITYLNEPDPSFKYITQPPLYGGKKCRDTIIDTGDIKEQVNYWQNNCWVCSEGTLCILSQKRIWEGYFSDGPQTRLLTVNPNFGTNTNTDPDVMTVATTEKLQCQTDRIYFEIITQKTENWIQYIKIKNKNSGLYAKFLGDHTRGGRLNFNEPISNASIFRLVYDGIRIIERVDSLNDKIILPNDPVSSVEIVPNTTNNLMVGSKVILLNGIGKLTSTATIQAITNAKQFQLNSPPIIPLQDASIIIIPPNINRNSGFFHLFTPEQPWNGMKCAPSLKAYIENVSSDYVKSDEEKTSTDYAIEKTEDPYVNSVFVLQNGIFCSSNTECLSFQECKDVTDPTVPYFNVSKGKMCQTKGGTDDSNYTQWESSSPPRVIRLLSTIETYEQPTIREMIIKPKTLVEQEIRPYDVMSITNRSVNQSNSNTSTSNTSTDTPQPFEVGKLASWVTSGDFIENDIFFYGGKTMIQGVDPERKRIVSYAAPKNPIPSEGITINIRRTPKLFFSTGSPMPSWVREGDIVYNPEFFEKDTRILKIINNKTCVLDKPPKKTLTNQSIIIMRWYSQSVNSQTGDVQYYFDANKFGDCRGLVLDMSEGYFNKFMPGVTTLIRFKPVLTYPEDYISDKCFPPLDAIPTNFSIVSISTIGNISKVYRFKSGAVFKIPGLIFTGIDNVPYHQEMQIVEKTTSYILVQRTDTTAYRVNQVYRAPDQTFWVIDSMLTDNNKCTYAGIEESTCTKENRTWVRDESTGQLYLSIDNIPGCYQMVWKWRC